jgi:hypothetical protein
LTPFTKLTFFELSKRQTRLKSGDETAPPQASFVNQNEIKPKIGYGSINKEISN